MRRRTAQERNPASSGWGPLLQRDYWAVIVGPELSPRAIMDLVLRRFADFSPAELARFRRRSASEGPLEVGDELEVAIRGAGTSGVRVTHRDANSLTLGTLQGHPEAGRITFGAYRNDAGEVIFHIRSRSRASSSRRYAEYVAIGQSLQANTWAEFITRVAGAAGGHVRGVVHEEGTTLVGEDERAEAFPTYIAKGR